MKKKGWIKRNSCPLCRNRRLSFFLEYPQYPGFPIYKCLDCGFVFSLYRPDKNNSQIINEDFFHLEQYRERIDTLRVLVRQREKEKKREHKLVLSLLKKKWNQFDNKKVLDIGCAEGSFLNFLKRAGFSTYGLDFNPSYNTILAGEGHIYVASSFEDFRTKNKFELITLNEVLEHMGDPLSVLQKCRQLLVPGGVIIVVVPNYAFHYCKGLIEQTGIFQKVLHRPVYGLSPKVHLNHFNVDSINFLARQARLKVISVRLRPPISGIQKYPLFLELTLRMWLSIAIIVYAVFGIFMGSAMIVSLEAANEKGF